jgi:hypothetical protein
MNKTVDHWIAVADTLKQQRDQAEKERDALRQELDAILTKRSQIVSVGAILEEVATIRAEKDALRKDAARLDWMADTVAIEAFGTDDVEAHFGCVGMDVYEHASIVADERGNDDDPTPSDQREGFRRMIDAAMEATP